jgi:hypothetical protein
MATSHITPELHPIDRIAGAVVTLVALALVMASVVTLCAALS